MRKARIPISFAAGCAAALAAFASLPAQAQDYPSRPVTFITPAAISFVHAAGAAASLNDVVAGRIPIMFEGLAGLSPAIQNNSVKVLGIASTKRLPNLPNLPTLNETVPGAISSGCIVLMAPAGVPDAITKKVNADPRKIVAMDVVRAVNKAQAKK